MERPNTSLATRKVFGSGPDGMTFAHVMRRTQDLVFVKSGGDRCTSCSTLTTSKTMTLSGSRTPLDRLGAILSVMPSWKDTKSFKGATDITGCQLLLFHHILCCLKVFHSLVPGAPGTGKVVSSLLAPD
ncbi:hypothetical protein UPYG_G00288030 [Umbra pygmaea]|uniref:Uncharacterized protein n=1 Tax=Umbra pygmaea TaxID=75934 RepID=A0ABD0W4W0_UMBPY